MRKGVDIQRGDDADVAFPRDRLDGRVIVE
jgi:hypothetical protein